MKLADYMVIESYDYFRFTRLVKRCLRNGWTLEGGVSTYRNWFGRVTYCQAVTLYLDLP